MVDAQSFEVGVTLTPLNTEMMYGNRSSKNIQLLLQ
jgi:hypothetical protein